MNGDKPLRLTKDVLQPLLEANEGFSASTHSSGKNFTESRRYEIADGQVHVHSDSNGSWADSRQSQDFVADEQLTRYVLNKYWHRLNFDGVSEKASTAAAARRAAEKAARQAAKADAAQAVSFVAPFPKGNPVPTHTNHTDVIAKFVAGALTVMWVFPHARRAWQTQAKPRIQARRARRTASATSVAESLPPEPNE